MVAVPAVGVTRLSSMRSVVVLPAPFGPRKPVTRPGAHGERQVVHRPDVLVLLRQAGHDDLTVAGGASLPVRHRSPPVWWRRGTPWHSVTARGNKVNQARSVRLPPSQAGGDHPWDDGRVQRAIQVARAAAEQRPVRAVQAGVHERLAPLDAPHRAGHHALVARLGQRRRPRRRSGPAGTGGPGASTAQPPGQSSAAQTVAALTCRAAPRTARRSGRRAAGRGRSAARRPARGPQT